MQRLWEVEFDVHYRVKVVVQAPDIDAAAEAGEVAARTIGPPRGASFGLMADPRELPREEVEGA